MTNDSNNHTNDPRGNGPDRNLDGFELAYCMGIDPAQAGSKPSPSRDTESGIEVMLGALGECG